MLRPGRAGRRAGGTAGTFRVSEKKGARAAGRPGTREPGHLAAAAAFLLLRFPNHPQRPALEGGIGNPARHGTARGAAR